MKIDMSLKICISKLQRFLVDKELSIYIYFFILSFNINFIQKLNMKRKSFFFFKSSMSCIINFNLERNQFTQIAKFMSLIILLTPLDIF